MLDYRKKVLRYFNCAWKDLPITFSTFFSTRFPCDFCCDFDLCSFHWTGHSKLLHTSRWKKCMGNRNKNDSATCRKILGEHKGWNLSATDIDANLVLQFVSPEMYMGMPQYCLRNDNKWQGKGQHLLRYWQIPLPTLKSIHSAFVLTLFL